MKLIQTIKNTKNKNHYHLKLPITIMQSHTYNLLLKIHNISNGQFSSNDLYSYGINTLILGTLKQSGFIKPIGKVKSHNKNREINLYEMTKTTNETFKRYNYEYLND
jgi:hypothetical protein